MVFDETGVGGAVNARGGVEEEVKGPKELMVGS
jgi:hypothetical protein